MIILGTRSRTFSQEQHEENGYMTKKILLNYYKHRFFWPIHIGIVIIIIISLILGITLSQNRDYRIEFNTHGGTPVICLVKL